MLDDRLGYRVLGGDAEIRERFAHLSTRNHVDRNAEILSKFGAGRIKSPDPSSKGLSSEQIALMERETANLDREFRIAEQSYGTDHLDLVLANGYLGKLLGNARVVRYLAQHQKEILFEFQKLVDVEAIAA